MDDEEGLPNFNFEDSTAGGGRSGRRRDSVCRYWLQGYCRNGDACDFLHLYDQSRFPVCIYFQRHGHCSDRECELKHSVRDIKERNKCRHDKLPGPPPPGEEVLRKIQNLNIHNYGSSSKTNQQWNAGDTQQMGNPQLSQGHNNQGWVVKSSTTYFPNRQQQQQFGLVPIQNMSDGPPNQANTASTPLPQGISRYFMIKSHNYENLEISVHQGVWATQWKNEAKLNEAFNSVENVILIFSVNKSHHIQGCAKMASNICGYAGGGNWKHESRNAPYGRNFSVKWLKLCKLPFHKTDHLRNPYNENFIVKVSRDCQELEPSVGEQLASLLYLEPDSELMAISVAAESKREEEKAKGRGKGKEIMRPQYMPMGRGVRPDPGMLRPYPPEMMGAGGVAPHGFGAPFGPGYSGDFRGTAPGMMFHGRPFQPAGGFGMMMGPGSGPFMGASCSNAGRAARPLGMPMFHSPPPLSSWNYNNNDQAPLPAQKLAGCPDDEYGEARRGPFLGASSSNIGRAARPQGMPMYPQPPPLSRWNYNNRAPLQAQEMAGCPDDEYGEAGNKFMNDDEAPQ